MCASFHWKIKLRKYLSGILSIDNYEAGIGKKTNQFKPISDIPEEPRYVSSMTPIGFWNGQD